jgi:hypothetical protein
MWFRPILKTGGLETRSSPAARRGAHAETASARSCRTARDAREETSRDADGVATPDARARELCRGTCRETVYPSFRHEASRTKHGSFPVARARFDASCGPALLATSEDSRALFESSRDSDFSDETTTVRGHEGRDFREEEKYRKKD